MSQIQLTPKWSIESIPLNWVLLKKVRGRKTPETVGYYSTFTGLVTGIKEHVLKDSSAKSLPALLAEAEKIAAIINDNADAIAAIAPENARLR